MEYKFDANQDFQLEALNAIIANLAAKKFSLLPDALFVCRDIALNDTTAANLALQCPLKTI